MAMFQNDTGGVGQLLAGPVVPNRGVVQPDQEKRGLWGNFMQRLEQDPNLRMALLQTGLGLMQDTGGRSGFDQFSRSVQSGVSTLDALRQRDMQNQLLERKEGRADKRVELAEEGVELQREGLDVRREGQEAQTGLAAARIAQDQTQFQQRMELSRKELEERIRSNQASEGMQAAAGVTGQERQVDAIVQSLQTAFPDRYGDEEGKAKARIRAYEVMRGGSDPTSLMRLAVQMGIEDSRQTALTDNPVNVQDATMQSLEYLQNAMNVLQGDQNAGNAGNINRPGDEQGVDGSTVQLEGGQQATVRKVGDNQYKLVVDGVPSKETYTAEQIQVAR